MKSNTPVSKLQRKSSRRVIRGQGMTEYIIVLALVALAAVVAVGYFGDTVQAQFAAMGQKLSGGAGNATIKEGLEQADLAQKEVKAAETLGTYAD